MNASELTFGIEIECTVPSDVQIRVGGRHNGVQIRELPAGWNAQSDGSIHAQAGHKGVEVVSGILRGKEGLQQIAVACEWLKHIGARVNSSCGLHVHVGFGSNQIPRVRHLVHTVANFEEGIFASTGTHSRERSTWCKSVRRDFRSVDARTLQRHGCDNPTSDRYHILNLSNLLYGQKPTVEFRAFGGTLNLLKIIAYVRLCLGLVERALTDKRTVKFEGKRPDGKSPMLRKTGNGYTQLTRLLYHLGWVKGRTAYVYGNFGGEGLPSVEECKSELRRLAKKYDRNPNE